jgi:hypothetical protein
VNDIHEIRAQLRRGQGRSPIAVAGRMLLFAACGVALFGMSFWLLPRIYPLKHEVKLYPLPPSPSPSIPTWNDVQAAIAKGQPSPRYIPDPAIQARPPVVASYQGKSAREVGKIADEVCLQRAHAHYPHWNKTPRLSNKELGDFEFHSMDHFNELLQCLLTEGLARYCSARERRQMAVEVRMYFSIIAHGNRDLDRWREQLQSGNVDPAFKKVQEALGTTGIDPDYLQRAKRADFVYDAAVLNAIEARLRDGLLTKAELEHFEKAAPQQIRARFEAIAPGKSACPDEPWWAFWL